MMYLSNRNNILTTAENKTIKRKTCECIRLFQISRI